MEKLICENVFAIINSRMRRSYKNKLIGFLNKRNIPFKETSAPGNATEIAQSSNAEIIIAAGGDGTINEVVNGIDLCKKKLCIIPSGTLNGIAHQLRIRDLNNALSVFDNPHIQRVDVVNAKFTNLHGDQFDRRILGFAAVGQDGRVALYAKKMPKLFPPLRYLLAGYMAVARVQKSYGKLCINNSTVHDRFFSSLVVNNSSANFFSTIKKWDMQDESAEVQIMNLSKLGTFFWGMLCLSPFSCCYNKKIKQMSIAWDKPQPLMMDGEVFENIVSFSMSVKPGALCLVLPQDAKVRR
jgi:diacylglycerol kinase family enzyme